MARVGMFGCSYEGFTVVMALVDPHPALKVAAPRAQWWTAGWAMTGFTMALSGSRISTTSPPDTARGAGQTVPARAHDDYENFRRAGRRATCAAAGLDQLPWWRKITSTPPTMRSGGAGTRSRHGGPAAHVPTMWIQGLWDQEDMWGAIHWYLAVNQKTRQTTRNFLVMGPWRHSGGTTTARYWGH